MTDTLPVSLHTPAEAARWLGETTRPDDAHAWAVRLVLGRLAALEAQPVTLEIAVRWPPHPALDPDDQNEEDRIETHALDADVVRVARQYAHQGAELVERENRAGPWTPTTRP